MRVVEDVILQFDHALWKEEGIFLVLPRAKFPWGASVGNTRLMKKLTSFQRRKGSSNISESSYFWLPRMFTDDDGYTPFGNCFSIEVFKFFVVPRLVFNVGHDQSYSMYYR